MFATLFQIRVDDIQFLKDILDVLDDLNVSYCVRTDEGLHRVYTIDVIKYSAPDKLKQRLEGMNACIVC